jgi:uncharacterized lipoprotein YajG
MNLIKKLLPLALVSLLFSCQTPKSVELNNSPQVVSKSSNSNNFTTTKQSSEKISSIYPVNNYTGYYYKDNQIYLVKFPKTILDTFIEGDYKIIKAR